MSSHGEREEDLLGLRLGLEHLAELLVVGVALGDRAWKIVGFEVTPSTPSSTSASSSPSWTNGRERKSIQTLWPCGRELVQGGVGHGASWRGEPGVSGQVRGCQRRHPRSATRAAARETRSGPRRSRAAVSGCAPASSRSQAATACSSRRASRRRAARAWLAVTEFAHRTWSSRASPAGRGRARREARRPRGLVQRSIGSANASVALTDRTRTNWFVVRGVETLRTVSPVSARSRRRVTGIPKRARRPRGPCPRA